MASWYETYCYQHKTLSLWVTSIKTHCHTFSCLALFSPKPYLDLASRNSNKGLSVDKFACNLATQSVLCWPGHCICCCGKPSLVLHCRQLFIMWSKILLEEHNTFGDYQQNGQEGMWELLNSASWCHCTASSLWLNQFILTCFRNPSSMIVMANLGWLDLESTKTQASGHSCDFLDWLIWDRKTHAKSGPYVLKDMGKENSLLALTVAGKSIYSVETFLCCY